MTLKTNDTEKLPVFTFVLLKVTKFFFIFNVTRRTINEKKISYHPL